MAVEIKADTEESILAASIDILRKIRTATVHILTEGDEKYRQAAFSDARTLVHLVSSSLLGKLEFMESTDKSLLLALAELDAKYRDFSPTSHHRYSSAVRGRDIAFNIGSEPEDVLYRVLQESRLADLPPELFTDPGTGIFVPLSSDYLQVIMLKHKLLDNAYIEEGERLDFNIEPISLDSSLQSSYLPTLDGKRVFNDKDRVLVLVDKNTGAAGTLNAAIKTIYKDFPDKLIPEQKAKYEH